MDILDLLDRALAGTGTVVDAITPDQLSLPTPCHEWDVRAVIGHLVRGNENSAAVAEGRPRDPDPIARPDDPVRAYHESSAVALRAWREHGDLDALYASPFGQVPGRVLLTLRLADNVTHGWDLARAIGQTPRYNDDVVATAIDFAQRVLPPDRRPPGIFAPPVAIEPDRQPIDRLAALLGRQI